VHKLLVGAPSVLFEMIEVPPDSLLGSAPMDASPFSNYAEQSHSVKSPLNR